MRGYATVKWNISRGMRIYPDEAERFISNVSIT